MADLAHAQVIECFHLAFLNVLPSRVRRENYVVKGGANLRYFYRSHRYSEDIDFDAVLGEGWKLTEQIEATLAAAALTAQLRRYSIKIENINNSKQTDTTRKWKLLLGAPGRTEAISTKVEFSKRNGDERFKTQTIDEHVVKPYGLIRPALQRYDASAATEQKIIALALRNETQARDVFDLDWLFSNYGDAIEVDNVSAEIIEKALNSCAALTYDTYRGQVIPFLEQEIVEIYGSEDAWNQMQTNVFEKLSPL
jgi:predicted nucleotidyltransferase component of viral defense system